MLEPINKTTTAPHFQLFEKCFTNKEKFSHVVSLKEMPIKIKQCNQPFQPDPRVLQTFTTYML